MKSYRTNLLAVAMSMALLTFANADGNVEVELNDGNLRLIGENNTIQEILISATDTMGRILLESTDNTTFNGAASVFVDGVFGDVRIDLGSGPKLVVLTEADQSSLFIPGDLNINSKGSSAAYLFLDTVEVDGTTSIKTKNGNDIVLIIGGQYNGRVTVNTGNGNDVFGTDLGSSGVLHYADDLAMQMGKGNDFALVANSIILGTADFRLGSGNDAAVVSDSEITAVSVKGNNGFDRFGEEFSFFMLPPVFSSVEDVDADINTIFEEVGETTFFEAAVFFFFEFDATH